MENKLPIEKVAPFIKLVKRDYYYVTSIFLLDLIKKEIKLKYINDFLIINMKLRNPYTNKIEGFKRLFYLKDLDIDDIKLVSSTRNIISFTIPIKK